MKKRYSSLYLISALSCCMLAHEQQNPEETRRPIDKKAGPSLTAQQLDDSLYIEKEQLALDNLLKKDLGKQIDALADTGMTSRKPQRKALSEQELRDQSALEKLDGRKRRLEDSFSIAAPDEKIELHFEDADLESLITQVSELFDITFIKDDSISPLPAGGKTIKGNKISFRTNSPLSKQQAWNLFLTFLDIAGIAVVPEPDPKFFRLEATAAARKAPIPTYIGVPYETLPDNDQLVRYLYFVQNGALDTIQKIVTDLRSSASAFFVLDDLNAFVLTDKSYNIKSLMNIVAELDRVSLPQSMSVLKLRRADALDVQKLYKDLSLGDDKAIATRLFPARKQPTALYFPENTRIIAEPRTNSLILLGPDEAIKKIEHFILTYVDVELGEETRSPLRTYTLKYADAEAVATIMNEVTKFGMGTQAGKVGGVRDGDKFFKPIVFTPQKSTNRLIIRGDEEDYLKARAIIERLDEPQPQVSIEALILSIALTETKNLGAQIRSKTDNAVTWAGGHSGLTGTNVKFQTSGINFGNGPSTFVVNQPSTPGTGVTRLLGNLISLLSPQTGFGNTVLTLGADAFGVWGIFNALQSIGNAEVISNPFMTVSNNQEGTVDVGTERRVVSSTITSGSGNNQNSFAPDKASLTLKVTPQINSDGMIVLTCEVGLSVFLNPDDPTSANKTVQTVKTKAILADKEVMAIGGLIKNTTSDSTSKVPVLGNIPILGWLFKNRSKMQDKSNLLILISAQIVPAAATELVQASTKEHIKDYYGTLDEMGCIADRRDPIHRFFFAERTPDPVNTLLFDRKSEAKTTAIEDKKKPKEKKKKKKESVPPAPQIPAPVAPAAPTLVSDKSKRSLAQYLSDKTGATA